VEGKRKLERNTKKSSQNLDREKEGRVGSSNAGTRSGCNDGETTNNCKKWWPGNLAKVSITHLFL